MAAVTPIIPKTTTIQKKTFLESRFQWKAFFFFLEASSFASECVRSPSSVEGSRLEVEWSEGKSLSMVRFALALVWQ